MSKTKYVQLQLDAAVPEDKILADYIADKNKKTGRKNREIIKMAVREMMENDMKGEKEDNPLEKKVEFLGSEIKELKTMVSMMFQIMSGQNFKIEPRQVIEEKATTLDEKETIPTISSSINNLGDDEDIPEM